MTPLPTLSLLAPAKLNLFLHITGKRADGYHNLQTVFQLLDYGDTMHFFANDSGMVTVNMPGLAIAPEQNLIVRAAKLLPHGHRGVHIDVDKRLPDGGGLGGGSSDAATTLLALNQLWQCGKTEDELAELGRMLGADVPVFVRGHSAWAEGIGEQLTPLELPKRWFIVIKPDCHVNTGEIFSHSRLTRDSSAITIAAFFKGAHRNDCQPLVRELYPEVDKALKWLGKFAEASLTGTGACVFAECQDQPFAAAVLKQLPKRWNGFIAQGVNISPTVQTLTARQMI
ncbi:MAG: 4-(cytidine 5'-diphospho)-2-C-methyl-D-erythritol kinase [Gammaproteobacteria bacterium]|nr:MAG: 4-(cytidine 5'-diphospho)-2-C-methyl-D-erythritol kinase [Gammaproteobacteria bacterium]